MRPEGTNRMLGPVLITGGTGFIGTHLAVRLLRLGISVSVLTRSRERP